jgi:hydrogenase maturation factor
LSELVDIAISANAQAAAEALGLRVVRNITSGTWIRRIPRDEAEIAVECLRDWGFIARIVEREPRDDPPTGPGARRAA